MSHKLLLADDSVTIQRVIELTFADEDVEVLTAGDGEQAIASIQSERPDIVLADVGMPKRSGYDVAAFVKGAPELSHIPVLLLTGAFEPVDERRAQAAGCDGVLVKPFEPQHVIARVRELLQAGAASTPAPAGGGVTRAVPNVPRPAERLAPKRSQPARPAVGANGADAGRSTKPGARPGSDLDDYFDRLDAAFANMPTADIPAARSPEVPRREGPVMERDLDWFDSPSETPSADASSALRVPPPGAAQPASGPPVSSAEVPAHPGSPGHAHRPSGADTPHVATPIADPGPVTFANPPVSSWSAPRPPFIEPPDSSPTRSPQPGHVPSAGIGGGGSVIADAFAALLAAEQGEADAPAVRFPMHAAPALITDEVVEDVARRVIQRLGEQGVRDLVADVVARVAERLVREEIERIRNKHA